MNNANDGLNLAKIALDFQAQDRFTFYQSIKLTALVGVGRRWGVIGMKTFTLSAVLFLSSWLIAGAKEKSNPDGAGANVNRRLAPEEFMIMPWGSTVDDQKIYDDIYECGFNLAGFVQPSQIAGVKKARLKCIVNFPQIDRHLLNEKITDREISEIVQKAVKAADKKEGVFGYYIKDEPSTWMYHMLGRWTAAFKEAKAQKPCYINLLPIGAQDAGAKNYDDYIDKFVEMVKPDHLSYDHYCFFDDGSMRPSFFQNLEVMRGKSLKYELPFWNIVLGNAHFHYAIPTDATIRLQAYATLAYGGKGICYFTYFTPRIGNYRAGAVDQFFHKTPTWDILRNVNLQIHQLGPTYLKLKSVNVFHHPEVPDGCQDLKTSLFLDDVTGGNFLVGEFADEGKIPYVMLVNKNIQANGSVAFGLKFKQKGTLLLTSPYTGRTEIFGGENGWLAPGQGMLISLATTNATR